MMVDLARTLIHRDRKQYPFIQNYLYERSTLYVRELGSLYEYYCHFAQNHRKGKSSVDAGSMKRAWTDTEPPTL